MTSFQQENVNKSRTVNMTSLFTRDQWKEIMKHVIAKDKDNLRSFLRSIAPDLLKKGAIADYMYYQICFRHGLD